MIAIFRLWLVDIGGGFLHYSQFLMDNGKKMEKTLRAKHVGPVARRKLSSEDLDSWQSTAATSPHHPGRSQESQVVPRG